MQIRFARSALDDLLEIQQHYREQGVPDVGTRLSAELIAHIEQLEQHPDIGRIVPEFSVNHLRELIHPPFRIVYWRDELAINIIRIWRSERELRLPQEKS